MKVDNWDNNIRYISQCDWQGISSKHYKKNYIDGIEIRIIDKDDHILKGERGIFACKKFEVGDIVGQYIGKMSLNNKFGRYVASLTTDDGALCIDAEEMGNEIRYINDYRNISNKPNCKLSHTNVDGKPVTIVVVVDPIEYDQEILLDYGEGYWKAYEKEYKM